MPDKEFTRNVAAEFGTGRSVAVEPGVRVKRQFGSGDLSGGVTVSTADITGFTVYIATGGAVDLTLEMSPDGGTTWLELPKSPLSYGSATEDMVFVEYEGDELRVTASNTTATDVWLYGV